MFDDIPEDRMESFGCKKCHYGSVEQNIISGRWECGSCDWKSAEPYDGEDPPMKQSTNNTDAEK